MNTLEVYDFLNSCDHIFFKRSFFWFNGMQIYKDIIIFDTCNVPSNIEGFRLWLIDQHNENGCCWRNSMDILAPADKKERNITRYLKQSSKKIEKCISSILPFYGIHFRRIPSLEEFIDKDNSKLTKVHEIQIDCYDCFQLMKLSQEEKLKLLYSIIPKERLGDLESFRWYYTTIPKLLLNQSDKQNND